MTNNSLRKACLVAIFAALASPAFADDKATSSGAPKKSMTGSTATTTATTPDMFAYYEFYNAGFNNDSRTDDDWFFDFYEYDADYGYFDADWFDWEEEGLFD